jgi:radical SAM protein with 4Fe4S-binding SPASM domain
MIHSLKDKIAYARGILVKRKAYKGPAYLELNITNICNFNCIGCFYHSELKNDRFTAEWRKYQMPPDLVLRLVDEAAKIRTSNIILTGNGEPTLYPALYDVINRIKKHNMGCMIITNGTGIDETMLSSFNYQHVDNVLVSLWDHDPDRYEALHPGHRDKLKHIKQWLTLKARNYQYPKVNLLFLLNKYNYRSIEDMVRFSIQYNVDQVTFKLFRVYDEITKDYLMDERDLAWIKDELRRVSKKYKKLIKTNSNAFLLYTDRMSNDGYIYRNNFLREMPCYVGWYYMVVLNNGDILPCCGCRKYVLGNIHRNSLSEIWHSKKYESFRFDALFYKDKQEFDQCNCVHACSHYQMNFKTHRFFKYFIKIRRGENEGFNYYSFCKQ